MSSKLLSCAFLQKDSQWTGRCLTAHGFILGGMTIGGTFSIVSIYVLVALSTFLSLASTFLPALHFGSQPLFDLQASMPGSPESHQMQCSARCQTPQAFRVTTTLKEMEAQVPEAPTVMVMSCLTSTVPPTYDIMVHILSTLPF